MDCIPSTITDIIALRDGHLFAQGRRAKLLDTDNQRRIFRPLPVISTAAPADMATSRNQAQHRDIIRFKGVSVRFGNQVVLSNFSWRVREGENWALIGPNGAGKSTLLAMIAGDQPQAYANEIYLFGRRRGSGESIWEIKRHIGLVSAEIHRRYHRQLTVRDVVASGFVYSVGLYRRCSPLQHRHITVSLQRLGLDHLQARPLSALSYGQQRLVLVARAMVKTPALLILDEPCQGLDPVQRQRLLAAIDQIGQNRTAQILYVTHYPDEIPACISHHLTLDRSDPVRPA